MSQETEAGPRPELGQVYEPNPLELADVPPDVQRRMFEGGRLRPVRYDGHGRWHVLSDEEIREREDEKLRAEAPVLSEDAASKPKFDLGCGLNPRKGYEGVDRYAEEATHKVDLFKFPWPWENESVQALHTCHFLEHVPKRDLELRDLRFYDKNLSNPELSVPSGHLKFLEQDFLFAMMDECHRILVPGGNFTIIVPNARSDGAFQDPTHRREWNQNTFLYFNAEMRRQLGVSHYRTTTDFLIVQRIPVGPTEIAAMHPEVQAKKWTTEWNSVFEWHAILRKKQK